jgi:hypothetical protein
MTVYEEILLGARVIMEPGHVYELRVTDGGRDKTVSGYFDSPEEMAREAASIDSKYPAIYCTLNPVVPDLIARACNRLRPFAKDTTNDQQIPARKRILIDLDPERPSGISSSDEEKILSHQAGAEVRDYLEPVLGAPVLADSGNGTHLMFRVGYPNNRDAEETIKQVLAAASNRLSVKGVKVDTAVFNAARLTKLYGTMTCKGDDFPGRPGIPARPHRRSRVLEVPAGWLAGQEDME